jgi:hypothetical protein
VKGNGCFVEQREGWKMAFVEPSKGRAKITDLGDRVRIEVPLRPKDPTGWLYLLFVGGWLIGWGASEVLLVSILLHQLGLMPQPIVGSSEPMPSLLLLFLVGFLLMWTAAGIFFLVWMLWILVGQEVIEASLPEKTLRVRSPFRGTSNYRLSEIANLRVLEDMASTILWWWRSWMMPTSGVIAFDYGASTIRFGFNLDPAEARQIVALLKERFGQYIADGKAGGMEDGVR